MKAAGRFAPAVALVVLAACGDARSVNGRASVGVCTACHGGVADGSGAPPSDLLGRSDTTLVSVGAHATHVAAGLDCDACHPKPAQVSSPGHGDGRVDLAWGAVATGGGSTTPTFDRVSGTCAATWCHGAFPGGDGANAPRWTRVGSGEGACGTCHGLPPTAGGHPRQTACGNCHAGYGQGTVNAATHVDGEIDVLPMSCTSCHGDAARQPTAENPLLAAAPPLDTRGGSSPSSSGVGAHQAHLAPPATGALRGAIACTECHAPPTTLDGHPTGTTTFAWGPLATAGGATPSYTRGECSNTYCHGATLGAGGGNHEPHWTGGASQAGCGTCHGVPPPAPHVQNGDCGRCHPGYGFGQVNPATHVNGHVELVALTCTTCHGDAARGATAANPLLPAAPPVDTQGAQASARVGAHLVHLQGSAIAAPVACTQCHAVPADPRHATGTVELAWGSLATGAITSVVSGPPFSGFSTAQPSHAGGACASTYCHGAYSGTFTYPVIGSDPVEYTSITYQGSASAPTWTGTAACGSCHGVPPATGGWHSKFHGGGNDCSLCHPDASGTSALDAAIVDRTSHVDGKVDLAPRFSRSCFGCH